MYTLGSSGRLSVLDSSVSIEPFKLYIIGNCLKMENDWGFPRPINIL